MKTTKDVFKEIRKREKKTQTQLGDAIGISQVSISFYENGGEIGFSKMIDALDKLGYSLELKKIKKVD